jgi:hypothetical protein
MIPYIDCWQDAVLSQPMWLKPHLEKACRVMVARVAATSKFREKCKNPEKPILVGDAEESLPLFCATVQIRKFLGAARSGSGRITLSTKIPFKATKGGEWEPMVWGKEHEKAFKKLRGGFQDGI